MNLQMMQTMVRCALTVHLKIQVYYRQLKKKRKLNKTLISRNKNR